MKFDELLALALQAGGSQGNLAVRLSMTEGELSKRISGAVGWKAPEINTLLSVAGLTIVEHDALKAHRDMLRILINESRGDGK